MLQRTRVKMLAGTMLMLGAVSATAQTGRAVSDYDRALAAGYKAAITCSAVFLGGRSETQIADDELRGIYPEYDGIVPTLKTAVDRARSSVSVPFSSSLPPRLARWHPDRGCTTYPIGYVDDDNRPQPQPAIAPPDPRPWPLGDALPRAAFKPLAPVAAAFDGATYGKGRTTAVLVVKGGRIVAERYAEGFGAYTAQRTWSVAKSITGTLVGIAVRAGQIDVGSRAPIEGWNVPGDPRQSITLEQLMRMASGLHSDTAGNRTDAVYFGGTTVTENVPGWPLEAKPGTRFRYANNDILLAMQSLYAALGEARYRNFPRDALFRPLGMAHTTAEADWQGHYVSSSQIWTTARDLARFGMLYAQDGMWNGERLLPENWRAFVSRPSGPQPTGEFGYGATFWLLNKSSGVPGDTFGAFGNRGQYVIIIPSRNVVIVRRGEDPTGATFNIAKFTADTLAAIG